MAEPYDTGLHYILDDEHRVVQAGLMEWARWFEDFERRRVGETFTEFYRVSTVFLGLDHNWRRKGPPIVFETMVFEREAHKSPLLDRPVHEELEGECTRYAFWDDAVIGHATTVKRVLRLEAEAARKLKGMGKEGQHAKTKDGREPG